MKYKTYILYSFCFLLLSAAPVGAAGQDNGSTVVGNGDVQFLELPEPSAGNVKAPSRAPVVKPDDVRTPVKSEPSAGDIKDRGTDYIIGPGDVLEISAWKEEALTKVVAVLPDGKIYFPLIGEVSAGGKSVAQLKREVESRISRYVPEVVLNVDVKQVSSLLIYVIGRVNNPGRQALNANITVLQALATAGGLNPFAKRSSIKIFRIEGNQTKIFKFDYDEVADGSNLQQNILLKRGDVIVVP